MTVRNWIKNKLKTNSVQEIYKLYNEFIKDTGSMMDYEGFKGTVRSLNTKGEVKPQLKREYGNNKQFLKLNSTDIKTKDDLINYANINLNEWEIKKHTIENNTSPKNPRFIQKCWLTKKALNHEEIKESIKKDLIKYSPKYKPIKRIKTKEKHLLEINIPDYHFGQLSWDKETGEENYDIKIAEKLLHNCVDYFINITEYFKKDRILFPVGSDFFNVNNALATTAKGTRQDEDCRWPKSFRRGLNLLIGIIDKLRNIADVDIYVIPGNHDVERAYYLGVALECQYRNDKCVYIENNPKIRKYYTYNKNLIGLTHGHEIKAKELPLTMSTEAKEYWSNSNYIEFHTGHLHHEIVKEYQKIKVRTIPSLCAASAWSKLKGFNSVRESQSFIWHPTKGNIAQFNYHI
jgi:hypothetical protein